MDKAITCEHAGNVGICIECFEGKSKLISYRAAQRAWNGIFDTSPCERPHVALVKTLHAYFERKQDDASV